MRLPRRTATFLVIVTGCWMAGGGSAGGAVADTRPIARALVTADGRQIIVPGMLNNLTRCHRLNLIASEKPRQVRLTIVRRPARGFCTEGGVVLVKKTLKKPMFGKQLTDTTNRKRVRFFDGRRLYRIGYLPRTYKLYENSPFVHRDLRWNDPKAPNAWNRHYTGGPTGWTHLEIIQATPAKALLDDTPANKTIRMGKHIVTVRLLVFNERIVRRSLTWRMGGFGFVVASHLSGAVGETKNPLSTAELLRIARSLRR